MAACIRAPRTGEAGVADGGPPPAHDDVQAALARQHSNFIQVKYALEVETKASQNLPVSVIIFLGIELWTFNSFLTIKKGANLAYPHGETPPHLSSLNKIAHSSEITFLNATEISSPEVNLLLIIVIFSQSFD